jgi:hypothetical protein
MRFRCTKSQHPLMTDNLRFVKRFVSQKLASNRARGKS